MKTIRMIEINQPIGTFYIGKMLSTDIVHIAKVSQRDSAGGHQRRRTTVPLQSFGWNDSVSASFR